MNDSIKPKKRSNFRWRVLALSLPITGFLWIVLSFVFRVIGLFAVDSGTATGPLLIDAVKGGVNLLLTILFFGSIAGTIIGIVKLVKNKRKNKLEGKV